MLLATARLWSQRLEPIHWSLDLQPHSAPPGAEVLARLAARMDPGWHLYTMTTPRPPIATTIEVAPNPAFQSVRIYQPQPQRKPDPNFGTETETFEGEATFLLVIRLAADAAPGEIEVLVRPRFQACDDRQCLPPRRISVAARLVVDPSAPAAVPAIPAGFTLVSQLSQGRGSSGPESAAAGTARPATQVPAESGGLPVFLIVAFGFGLAAV
ncbi:MAG: protein-disulfide reductase DsbD N-terminal domain-containing protein, partial [Bryobacteraceae bacterium]